MRKLILFFAVLFTGTVHAQVQLGIFTGLSDYNGDLLDKPYRLNNFAFGLTGGYQFSSRFTIRAGATFGKIEGSDKVENVRGFAQRNLSSESKLSEFSIIGEYNFFNIENTRWSPFAFTGIAVYHYNPYTFDDNKQKVFLKPLSTEGQGLPQYPDRNFYALTKPAIPVGGGIKYAISDRVQVAGLIGLRITNNDYLDDVSTTYVDESDLLAARGPRAVELAYRTDELPGGSQAYPGKGTHRGQGGKLIYTDFYYFSGLHLTISLGGDGSGSYSGGGARKKGYGCPVMRY